MEGGGVGGVAVVHREDEEIGHHEKEGEEEEVMRCWSNMQRWCRCSSR
jgi:hypothetical protein